MSDTDETPEINWGEWKEGGFDQDGKPFQFRMGTQVITDSKLNADNKVGVYLKTYYESRRAVPTPRKHCQEWPLCGHPVALVVCP